MRSYAPGQATFIFCMVFLSLLRFCLIFVRAILKNLRQDQVAFSESATFYVIVVLFSRLLIVLTSYERLILALIVFAKSFRCIIFLAPGVGFVVILGIRLLLE